MNITDEQKQKTFHRGRDPKTDRRKDREKERLEKRKGSLFKLFIRHTPMSVQYIFNLFGGHLLISSICAKTVQSNCKSHSCNIV